MVLISCAAMSIGLLSFQVKLWDEHPSLALINFLVPCIGIFFFLALYDDEWYCRLVLFGGVMLILSFGFMFLLLAIAASNVEVSQLLM